MTRTNGSPGEICQYLAKMHLDQLERGQAPVKVPPSLWETLATASGLAGPWPDRIDRVDLRSKARELDDDHSRLTLFVWTLAWGRNIARWPKDACLESALRDPRLTNALSVSAALVAAGVPTKAYEAWQACRIPGIGQAFITKWLFACGLGRPKWDDALQPLILDSRVWAALNALGWTSWHDNGRSWRPDESALYGAYLRSLRDWTSVLAAMGHTTSPEHLEILLFDKKGAI